MSIHEQLPKEVRKELKRVGWSKAAELAKAARRDQEGFDCANWLHKAQRMPMQEFRGEVEKYLTGESEPSELIYFKVFRSQLPVIEQALEIAARMLGSDKSRGYLLEMIAADFLAGASANEPNFVLEGIRRLLPFLTPPQLHQLIHTLDNLLSAGVEARST